MGFSACVLAAEKKTHLSFFLLMTVFQNQMWPFSHYILSHCRLLDINVKTTARFEMGDTSFSTNWHWLIKSPWCVWAGHISDWSVSTIMGLLNYIALGPVPCAGKEVSYNHYVLRLTVLFQLTMTFCILYDTGLIPVIIIIIKTKK